MTFNFEQAAITLARIKALVVDFEAQIAAAKNGMRVSRSDTRAARYSAVLADYESGVSISDIQTTHGISRKTVFDILDRFPDVERRSAKKLREAEERAEADGQAAVDKMFADPARLASMRAKAAAGTLRKAWLDEAEARGIDLLGSPDSDLF